MKKSIAMLVLAFALSGCGGAAALLPTATNSCYRIDTKTGQCIENLNLDAGGSY